MYNALSHMYIIIYLYTHLYLYVIGLTMFHLRLTTFLNRGITRKTGWLNGFGMPQSNGQPTLHIDATVWLYRNGNGLHPYLRGSCALTSEITARIWGTTPPRSERRRLKGSKTVIFVVQSDDCA